MEDQVQVFKLWVPEWLIRLALLLVLLPGIVLFGLSVSNAGAAAGYYGINLNDAQFSLIILYGAMASFVVLEKRFLRHIPCKEYLLIGVLILMGTCYACYHIHAFFLLLIFRYLQGLLTAATISITLTLMFHRLHGERAREIGYSVVYCILLCVTPLSTLFTAAIIDAFDFNVVYKCAIYSYLPGAVIMAVIMNHVRLDRKLPLYQVDWPSFVLYSSGICLMGYVLIYGQQYEWLDDPRICGCLAAATLLFVIFAIRQSVSKRPYIHLQVFKIRNFILASFLLFVFYLCRGSFGITTAFMTSALGLDPIHTGYLLMYNIAAIICSVIIASRLVLLKKPLRLILVYGFVLLLVFHVYMSFLFSTRATDGDLVIPLILQGLGVGMLMVPIILFVISSAPAVFGNTGSAVGIFVRYTGFCSSIALLNYFQLRAQGDHFNRFREQVSELNPLALQRLTDHRQGFIARGIPPDQAAKMAVGMLNKTVATQAHLRFAMDYYQLISWLLVGVILIIILFPYFNRTVIKLTTANQPAPIAY